MSAGNYVAFATDQQGTYYLGPGRCFGYFVKPKKPNVKYFSQPCGIFSSNDDGVWRVIELPDYSNSDGKSAASGVGSQFGAGGSASFNGLQSMMESYDQKRIFIREKYIIDKEHTNYELVKQ